MKILVTGATGFIGSAFARLALRHGHDIAGLMLPTEQPPAWLPAGDRMVWIPGTLADLPWPQIEAFRPEACVHFAWIATPGVYLESPENEKHLEWSLNLARRLKQLGVRTFTGVGTCIEYQITHAPLSEECTPVAPTTLYARCKNALRETLEAEARKDGSLFCWGRVFYPYGVGEHPARLCSSLIQRLRRGEKLALRTPHSTKDYVYIEDLAAAILLTVEKQFQGTINWGTGVGVSVRQIADAAAAMVGHPELVAEISPPENDPFGYVVADATRLKTLGWQQQFSLEQGLRKLMEYQRGRASDLG
jgi:dTDP-6-deoxy-L-talose 4-dehydrogenase (NAD+)